MLYLIEESNDVKGVLVVLNIVGGDIEVGLVIVEFLNSIFKKVVIFVLGGSYSIGVFFVIVGDYLFIVLIVIMIIYLVWIIGFVIGINEIFEYFKKM